MALAEIQRAQVTKRLTAFCDARVLPTARSFDDLLAEVAADPTGIFWG